MDVQKLMTQMCLAHSQISLIFFFSNHFRVDYNLNENEGSVCNFTHQLAEGPCTERFYGNNKVCDLFCFLLNVAE